MTRIVVHAGFHKTGTTSVQHFLSRNSEILAPHLRVLLKPEMETLTETCRLFSRAPSAEVLTRVGSLAETIFREAALQPGQSLLLCSEDLSGLLPGRRGVTSYDSLPALAGALALAADRAFAKAKAPDISFYFGTRGREAWLRSAWWQSLRVTRLTLGFEAFAESVSRAPEFETILDEVRSMVHPYAVQSTRLEDCKDLPFGPADPLLTLLALPLDVVQRLERPVPVNAQPKGLAEVFLALNRTPHSDDWVRIAKRKLRALAPTERQR